LQPDDTWQDRYISGADEMSPELRFWLSAAHEGDTSSSGRLPRRKNPPPTPVETKPAKKTGKKKAGKKKATKGKKAQKKRTRKTAKKKMAKKKTAKKKRGRSKK
jgi:hypothetical protein